MKTSIFVLSHGYLCEELINSTKFIYGKIDNIYSFPLEKGVSLEGYMKNVESKISEVGGDIIFLSDIYGGTPANVSLAMIRKYDYLGFTGMNMPLLISLIESIAQNKNSDDLLSECKKNYIDNFHILSK